MTSTSEKKPTSKRGLLLLRGKAKSMSAVVDAPPVVREISMSDTIGQKQAQKLQPAPLEIDKPFPRLLTIVAIVAIACLFTAQAARYMLLKEQRREGIIGDGATSEGDASDFFAFLDSDEDGQIEQGELRDFVGGSIGGLVLDSKEEIEAGVAAILDSADADADRQLSSSDMRAYWKSLGSLLSVDEVALWVQHAAQLPPEVAAKFKSASVSGYDFVELVRDRGDALQDEVGVTVPRQRAKLVRAMRMRLMGIGSVPTKPSPLTTVGPLKCTEIHLAWSPSEASGFPVHKYRLERKQAKGSHWETLVDGYLHEYRDETLKPGSYEYRVASWNAIGRSNYATLTVAASAREECDAAEYILSMLFAPIAKLFTSAWFMLQISLYAFALLCAVLRLGHTQSPDENHPFFAQIWASTRRILPRRLTLLFDVALSATPTAAQQLDARVERHAGYATPALVGTAGSRNNSLPPEMSATAVAKRIREPAAASTECYICSKAFVLGYRSKHHCYVCARAFCKSCGNIRHSNLTTCPLGAKCVCLRCEPRTLTSSSSFEKKLNLNGSTERVTPERRHRSIRFLSASSTATIIKRTAGSFSSSPDLQKISSSSNGDQNSQNHHHPPASDTGEPPPPPGGGGGTTTTVKKPPPTAVRKSL